MIRKRLIMLVVFPLLLLPLASGPGFAQGKTKAPASAARMEKEIVKGTIDFNERLGGYFIRGQEPGGEFFIVNQNTAVLKKLKDNGKSLTIQGRTTDKGAEYFFIERIDGKKYSAPKPAKKKAASK
jgi:hypothetical protein